MVKMKTLFIIHSTNMIYGAARSLSTVTRSWDDEFDIVFPKDFPRDFLKKSNRFDGVDFHEFYGKNLRNVYYAWMPFIFALNDENKETIKWKIKYSINYMLGKLFQHRIYQIIEKNQYDIVHLNSLILFPLLTSKYPMFIHVREVTNAQETLKRWIVKKFGKAKGVIFIDNATEVPFSSRLNDIRSIVLNNPFDMRGIELLDKISIRQRYHINDGEVVFTIAGAVAEVKGVDFVIQCFVKTKINAKLLVVGSGEQKFLDKCEKIAGLDNRVVFTGELIDMLPIYAISDYIVRGDDIFCIGRTTYEGLYARASVIVPGSMENEKDMFEYEKNRDRIFFYPPRNETALVTMFEKCDILKNNVRIGDSNVVGYLEEFSDFVKRNGKKV